MWSMAQMSKNIQLSKKGSRTYSQWLQEEQRQLLEPFRIEEWKRKNPRQMPDPFSSVSKSTSFLLESEETWDRTSCFLVMGGTRAWPAMTWKIALPLFSLRRVNLMSLSVTVFQLPNSQYSSRGALESKERKFWTWTAWVQILTLLS